MARNDDKKASLSEETGVTNGAAKDDPIDQVRKLLFGSARRQTDDNIRHVEARLDEMRIELLERVSVLESRIVELARGTESSRAATVDAIGAAIGQLGATIQSMSERRKA